MLSRATLCDEILHNDIPLPTTTVRLPSFCLSLFLDMGFVYPPLRDEANEIVDEEKERERETERKNERAHFVNKAFPDLSDRE